MPGEKEKRVVDSPIQEKRDKKKPTVADKGEAAISSTSVTPTTTSSEPELSEQEKQLSYIIQEIIDTENDFRKQMQGLYQALAAILPSLPIEYQKELAHFLEPYKILQENPFADIKLDPTKIAGNLDAIATKFGNKGALQQQFKAFLTAADKEEAFIAFLEKLREDPRTNQYYQQALSVFTGMVNKVKFSDVSIAPAQRFPRYKLLADDLRKVVTTKSISPLEQASRAFVEGASALVVKLNEERPHEQARPFTDMIVGELEKARESLPPSQYNTINSALNDILNLKIITKEQYLKDVAQILIKTHPSHHAKNGLFRGVSRIDKAIYELEKKIAQHPYCGSKSAYNEARGKAKFELREQKEEMKKAVKKEMKSELPSDTKKQKL